MKKNLTLLMLCISAIASAQYQNLNISLLSHYYNPAEVAEPVYGIKYNSVWGWTDTTNSRQYAILGGGSGTYIVEVTNPSVPVLRDFVPGRRSQCIWREYKTYKNYLYAVSDDNAPNSFQIIDLSYLPDSVHVVHDDTTILTRSHTIYIDGDKLYGGSVHAVGGYYSMAVYSLANPEVPVLLRTLNQDDPSITYAHDMMVRNDTVYASCGNQGLFIYKYNAIANNFSIINNLTSYPDQGYNHSSTLSPDGHTLIFTDEVPANKAVKAIDITDITNITVASTFKSNEGATAHNPYYYGRTKVVIAYYQDGVQIFDVSNPATVWKTGFFDTDTLKGLNDNFDPNPTYHGCWGAYVDFGNKIILASDMQNGLYVLDATLALGVREQQYQSGTVGNIYPVPSSDHISVNISLREHVNLNYRLYDVTGKIIMQRNENAAPGELRPEFDISALVPGLYFLEITGGDLHYKGKVVKAR